MIELDPYVVTWLALIGVGLSALLLLAVIVLALRLRRLRRAQERAFGGGSGENVVGALGRLDTDVTALRSDLATVQGNTEHVRELLRGAVSKVGVVRYDAFDDMGGALSFSAALLDERGNGVVVSAINGRTETRCYAKSVTDGASDHHLSGEEQAALTAAVEGRATAIVPPGRARRRRSAS